MNTNVTSMARTSPQYGGLDLVKFVCALLIISSHYISENATGRINKLVDYASSIYIIVVPFFFMCGGYFLFKKIRSFKPEEKKINVLKYCKKLGVMYISWSVIYIFFNILTWIKFDVNLKTILYYILNSIFYSTYKTIWFLPGMIIGVLLVYYLQLKVGIKKTMIIALIFYTIGCLGASYSFVLDYSSFLKQILLKYNVIFVSTRNGLFNGFPFVTLGALLSNSQKQETEEKGKFGDNQSLLWCIIYGILFLIEAIIIKVIFNSNDVNTLFFLLPFTYFFVKYSLSLPLKASNATYWMRKMSTTVFLCQRIYLSALPGLFPNGIISRILKGNPYIALLVIILIILITSEIIILLSRKIKILQNIV